MVRDSSPTIPLRARKRLAAMRKVQQVAVDAFTERGFEAVTIEELATEADVSPVSIYRWFGTKEGIVLWDEYEPPLFETIAVNLAFHRPVTAVRLALAADLDRMYDRDRARVLARSKLACSEPSILAASTVKNSLMTEGLATLFDGAEPHVDAFNHRVMAAAIVAALTEAITQWTQRDGASPLSDLINRAFAVLAPDSGGVVP